MMAAAVVKVPSVYIATAEIAPAGCGASRWTLLLPCQLQHQKTSKNRLETLGYRRKADYASPPRPARFRGSPFDGSSRTRDAEWFLVGGVDAGRRWVKARVVRCAATRRVPLVGTTAEIGGP